MQENFKTVQGKDSRTHEVKLSWNKPKSGHLKVISIKITNGHSSRKKMPICPEKETKNYFWELSHIFKCELCIKTIYSK